MVSLPNDGVFLTIGLWAVNGMTIINLTAGRSGFPILSILGTV